MADNVWPDAEVAEFHETVGWLYGALDKMGLKVLEAISVYLGLERHFFDSTVDFGNSILRLLHYPPVPFDGPHIRAAHEDINVITRSLLSRRGRGWRCWTATASGAGGQPPPGALVCNIGDMLQRLTSNEPAVDGAPGGGPKPERGGFARYSTPFFLHFNSDYRIETLPNCVDAAHPDAYPTPITADRTPSGAAARDQARLGKKRSTSRSKAQNAKADLGSQVGTARSDVASRSTERAAACSGRRRSPGMRPAAGCRWWADRRAGRRSRSVGRGSRQA